MRTLKKLSKDLLGAAIISDGYNYAHTISQDMAPCKDRLIADWLENSGGILTECAKGTMITI